MLSYQLGYKWLVGKEQHLTNSWNWLGFPTGEVVWCNSELLGREFVYHGWGRLRSDSPIHTAQSLLRCQCWCGRQTRGWAWQTGELVSGSGTVHHKLQSTLVSPSGTKRFQMMNMVREVTNFHDIQCKFWIYFRKDFFPLLDALWLVLWQPAPSRSGERRAVVPWQNYQPCIQP